MTRTIGERMTRINPDPPHIPDPNKVDTHIRVACWYIHEAIRETTGATLVWNQTTPAYKAQLTHHVRTLVESGAQHE
jgi:hypothetical protein